MSSNNNDSQSVSDEVQKSSEAPSAPAKTRRRGGRRVVRQAGAAGAKLPVTVDESAPSASKAKETPLEKTSVPRPAVHAETQNADSSADSSSADSSTEQRPSRARSTRRKSASSSAASTSSSSSTKTPAQRRTRSRQTKATSSAAEKAASTQSTRSSKSQNSSAPTQSAETDAKASAREKRVRALAQELFSDPGIVSGKPAAASTTKAASNRPMTSLLFQEPVLPAGNAAEQASDSDDSRTEEASDETPTTRTRKRRQSSGSSSTSSSRRSGNARTSEDESDSEESASTSPRRRSRNRRLNAQERRAAAEVEQIEEDLQYDEVSFSNIEDDDERGDKTDETERKSESEDSEEHTTTRRRRRRRRTTHENAEDQGSDSESSNSSSSSDRESDSEEEAPITRRRRRRRTDKSDDESGSSSSSSSSSSSRRSRKQQYIDEITNVEGSTRLEAKRQRRRENRRDRSRQTLLTEQDFLARREKVDRQMVVREKDRHTQISVIEDDILVEHYVSDIQEVSTVGNIYLGRVQNVLPSMEAAFVDIGKPRNGVLYAGEVNWDSARLEGHPRRIELAYHSGDPVLVQVTKDPIGHKGARLTSQITLAGRFIVLVPSGAMTGVSRKLPERERTRLKKIVQAIAPKDMGVIIRTAAEGASEEAITKDCEALVQQWQSVTEKMEAAKNQRKPKLLKGEPDVAIRVVRDIFNDDFRTLAVQGESVYVRIKNYLEEMAPDLLGKLTKWDPADHQGKDVFDQWQIDGQLRKGMERQVYLPSGGSLVIDRTEAMTTIDVNTGRFIGKGKSLEETVTRCNLEAAEEIVRQLRLRDIGGMVMIDFVDMVLEANRDLVLRRLVECLARDRTKHQVAEVTSLGLVQMTRKRVGQGLVEAFSEECPTCHGRGFILHDEPTVSHSSDDPYAAKGGDPFISSKKRQRSAEPQHEEKEKKEKEKENDENAPKRSTAEVRAKLAAIAAAASRHEEGDDSETQQENEQ